MCGSVEDRQDSSWWVAIATCKICYISLAQKVQQFCVIVYKESIPYFTYATYSCNLIGFIVIAYFEHDANPLISLGTWSSPTVKGTRPPPCSHFSFTKMDDHHAVLFGGWDQMDVYIVNLNRMVS